MKTKVRAGDIFSIPLPNGKFAFGRVMLDVYKQCISKRLIESDSSLNFFKSSLLIELYKNISNEPVFTESEILIAGIFVDLYGFEDNLWSITSNKPVNPVTVDFPESLIASNDAIYFKKGELKIATDLTEEAYDELKIHPTINSSYSIGSICLHYLGLDEFIEENFRWPKYLESSDLRYSPALRSNVYEEIGEDINQTYYEMSSKYGLDVSRFFK